MPLVTRSDIEAAYAIVAPHVRATPLLEAALNLSFKLELTQHAGSFKTRGAFHHLLTRLAPPAGVTAASGGNHGAAVAYAARAVGVKAKIFVPEISSPAKVAKIRDYGADVHIEGARYADAQALCDAHERATGALKIHPYDSPTTIAGAGTVGLEWERDLAVLGHIPLDTVFIAVGGGGLIAGVAAWFAGRAKVIAVEPEGSRALFEARKAGGPVDVEVNSLAGDSLGAKRVGDHVWAHLDGRLADSVLVSDAAIREAQMRLWGEFRIVVEPGGAAAYAAVLSGARKLSPGERAGVLLCGGNADLATLVETRM